MNLTFLPIISRPRNQSSTVVFVEQPQRRLIKRCSSVEGNPPSTNWKKMDDRHLDRGVVVVTVITTVLIASSVACYSYNALLCQLSVHMLIVTALIYNPYRNRNRNRNRKLEISRAPTKA